MLPLTINNTPYQCPVSWDEVTLKQAAYIDDRTFSLSQDAKDYLLSLLEPEPKDLSDEVRQEITDAFKDLFVALGDMPEDVLNECDEDDVWSLGIECLLVFILSMLSSPLYEAKEVESFEFKGETFLLPKHGHDVMGNNLPLCELTAEEICEASDIVAIDDMKVANILVAALCRKEGEAYDEEIVKARAKRFEDLPAYIYFEVLLQVNAFHNYCAEEYPNCYSKRKGKGGAKGKPTTWGDRLLYVANDLPSEVPIVKHLNGYEFMRLLNAKLKREKEQWQIQKK